MSLFVDRPQHLISYVVYSLLLNEDEKLSNKYCLNITMYNCTFAECKINFMVECECKACKEHKRYVRVYTRGWFITCYLFLV